MCSPRITDKQTEVQWVDQHHTGNRHLKLSLPKPEILAYLIKLLNLPKLTQVINMQCNLDS